MIRFLQTTSVFAMLLMATAGFAQPGNDLCIYAIDINSLFSTEVGVQLEEGPFSNEEATGEAELAAELTDIWFDVASGETAPTIDQSVWFSFTGNGETYQLMTFKGLGSAMYANDTQMALYSGTCDDLTLVKGNEDMMPFWSSANGWWYSTVSFTAEAGVSYWVMVDGFNHYEGDNYQGVAEGSFSLRAMNTEPMIERGVCDNARAIDAVFEDGVIGPFDDSESVTGLGVDYEADMVGTECWNDDLDDGSVWFSFIGDGNSYYLSMNQCSSNGATFVYYFAYDGQMAVYRGDCNELVPVACGEDFDEENTQYWPVVGIDTEEGVEYFVRLDGFHWNNGLYDWSAEGTFCLTAEQSNNPINVGELVQSEFEAFPNPTAGGVTITWSDAATHADVTAFDVTGKAVGFYPNVQRGQQHDLGLPVGMYTLQIATKNTSGVVRVQVQK